MLIPQYDVIVIGNGPAGVAASIICIQKGLSVLLIGYENKLHNITPAESVHSGILSLLSILKAEECLFLSSIGKYEGIRTGNNITYLGSDENEIWVGHHLNRCIFDKELLNNAIDQNISILDNDKVKKLVIDSKSVIGVITQSNKKIISKYVIDASGFRRFAGKELNFNELFFSPSLISWSGISNNIEIENPLFQQANTHFVPNKYGWTWIAPTPPNSCTWTCLALKGKQSFSPPSLLSSYPLLGNIRKANMRWRMFRPLCKEGIILCGDAAGIIDPAAGQGILNALYSGIKAAHTVISCINNPDAESIYLFEYDDWFSTEYMEKINRLRHYYNYHNINII